MLNGHAGDQSAEINPLTHRPNCICSRGLNSVNSVKAQERCLLFHLLHADGSRKFGRVHTRIRTDSTVNYLLTTDDQKPLPSGGM